MPFNRISGQHLALQIIQKALQNKTVAHAYLFYGPESVGKKLTAIELAKALNCAQSEFTDACGECPSCQKIERRVHPDLFIVEPSKTTPSAREGAIRIDDIRELQRKLGYLPYEGKRKVAIIDAAELMNLQAANSFLKTLEEPPSKTVIILIAPNLYQLLPTLISRCQGIKFSPLPTPVVRQILAAMGSIDPQELDLRAGHSMGQVNLALEQDPYRLGEERKELMEMIAAISYQRLDVVFGWAKTHAKQTETLHSVLDILMTLLRDLALLKTCGANAPVQNKDLASQLKPLADKKSLRGLLKMFSSTQDTKKALAANANTQLSLESLLLNFCDAGGLR